MNGISMCGGLSHLHLMICCCNFHLGPWEGNSFHQKMVAGLKELVKCAGPSDPLFVFFLGAILNDEGQAHRLSEPGIAVEVFATLHMRRSFEVKGQKVASSRWFQFINQYSVLDFDWHVRLRFE
jgi:recombinational DNA repair protein (RecF pathway)